MMHSEKEKMMFKPVAGQEVFVVRPRRKGIEEVTKVGRIYFYIGHGVSQIKVSIETGRIESETYGCAWYESQKAYDEKLEAEMIRRKIKEALDFWSGHKLTLSQLREAAKVLGIDL